ncbi:MAG: FHA domain-containing protein [Planctomycetia bacterium]|nr:FHA domain-containing protein [Planctomycetia bacterium]
MDILLKILDDSTEHFSKRVTLPCLIGRSRQSNVSVVHPLVSRQHCEIYYDNNIIKVRDLGSLNGTFYHSKRISRSISLSVGDYFMIGNLKFIIQEAFGGTTKIVKTDNPEQMTPQNNEDHFDAIEAIVPMSPQEQMLLSKKEINDNDDIIDLAMNDNSDIIDLANSVNDDSIDLANNDNSIDLVNIEYELMDEGD